MKILLSADWHLKHKHHCTQIVEGKIWDRWCQEKLNTLNRLPNIAKKYECDIIIIAGDIFDTSNPPEALKAEFCKIINKLKTESESNVIIIPGRPGDHDFVNSNNYVLMDLKESFQGTGNIYIHNSNYYELPDIEPKFKILIAHDMLEGIDERYRKSIPLNDKRWKDYETI